MPHEDDSLKTVEQFKASARDLFHRRDLPGALGQEA